jgi:hypothetical protein
MTTTYGTTTGRMQGKSYSATLHQQLQQMRASEFRVPQPWLDARGRMRIDVVREWNIAGHFFSVHVKHMAPDAIAPFWKNMEIIRMPTGMTRKEASEAQRALADLAALKLGHPYKLRSGL